MLLNLRLIVPVVILTGLAGSASADVISDWNENSVAFVTMRRMLPPQAERVMATVHVAMFDAVNSIEHRYRPYLLQLPAAKGTSKEAAAAAAAGAALAGLHPNATEEMNAALTAYLAAMPPGPAKEDGIKLGRAIAAKIVAQRATDGSDAADAYRPKTRPGVYVPTPITASSMWPNVTPFAMMSQKQHDTIGTTDGRRPFLAHNRSAELLPDRSSGRCGEEHAPHRQRAIHGAGVGRGG